MPDEEGGAMTDQPTPQPAAPAARAPAAEVYTQRDNPAREAQFAARTAAREGAFFLPYLAPGMRLLDVGSGPGSITLGLAELVAPAEVVGVDLQSSQVERARALAVERGVATARFEVANVYALPFPDASFDAAFAQMVLMHLREPVRALREVRRVLRPGGVVGVRDADWGGDLWAPMTPLLAQWAALRVRVRRHNGGDPHLGRAHRRLLLEAGFVRPVATASLLRAGSPEETREHAAAWQAQLPGVARTALAEGWVDQAAVDAIAAEIDAWARRPDAFAAEPKPEAVGWVAG
jgi:SAM-dependent methyltransferase